MNVMRSTVHRGTGGMNGVISKRAHGQLTRALSSWSSMVPLTPLAPTPASCYNALVPQRRDPRKKLRQST